MSEESEYQMRDDLAVKKEVMPSLLQLCSLKGQTAIVTGAARGIGARTAYRLAEAGACVVCVDLNEDLLLRSVKSIKDDGFEAVPFIFDLSKIDEMNRVVDFTINTYGCIDILANIAVISPCEPFPFVTEPVWDKVFEINLKAGVFLAQAVANQMIKQGRHGKIINCLSVSADKPSYTLAAYDTAKSAMQGATRVLAKDLAAFDIRVNAIAPGATATPGVNECYQKMLPWFGMMNDKQKMVNSQQMVGILDNFRVSDPDEQARGIFFLASDLSSYITGTQLNINGGFFLI